MMAELPKSCYGCRGRLIVQSKEDVTEKKVDGRRILSVVCPACGETNEFLRTLDILKTKESWEKFK